MSEYLSQALVGYGHSEPDALAGLYHDADFPGTFETNKAALGVSQIAISASMLVPGVSEKVKAVRTSVLKREPKGAVATALGAGILGMGMAVAGTIYAQIGSGVAGSRTIMYGAGAGVIAFSIAESFLKRKVYPMKVPKVVSFDDELKVSYPMLSALSGVFMIGASLAFGYYTPNSKGIVMNADGDFLSASFWSPLAAGTMIGLLQLPSIIFMGEPLGMSSSFVALMSLVSRPLEALGLISSQALYVLAAIAGSMTSAMLGETYGTSTGLVSGAPMPFVSPIFGGGVVQAFVGGFLLWLGARIAGGCTSGHGISGFALLKKMSVLAVPAMFGAGIITMHLLKYVL